MRYVYVLSYPTINLHPIISIDHQNDTIVKKLIFIEQLHNAIDRSLVIFFVSFAHDSSNIFCCFLTVYVPK